MFENIYILGRNYYIYVLIYNEISLTVAITTYTAHSDLVRNMPKKNVKNKEGLKPKDLIEDIYPHQFWLEKYNNINKKKLDIFDKYVPHYNGICEYGTFLN